MQAMKWKPKTKQPPSHNPPAEDLHLQEQFSDEPEIGGAISATSSPVYCPSIRYADHTWHHGWQCAVPDGEVENWWIEDPIELPIGDPAYLCLLCRHVNFEMLMDVPFWKKGAATEYHVKLGNLDETLQRPECAFCRLVISKVLDSRDADLIGIESCAVMLSVVKHTMNSLRFQIELMNVHRKQGQVQNQTFFIQEVAELPGKGRIVSSRINPKVLKLWANLFDHPVTSGRSHRGGNVSLEFIDIERQCVVTNDCMCKYAALSYVWGGISHTRYTRETQHLLKAPGGLESKLVILPKTIRDAMSLTSSLGLRYLWIDSLCILQDDSERKAAIISRMASIYGNAAITIVATAGYDSEAGLPGVGTTTRKSQQHIEMVQDLRLATVLSISDSTMALQDVNTSKWNTRGWTYQERMLSNRLLFVTPSQMCIMSNDHLYFEDTHEIPPDFKNDLEMPKDVVYSFNQDQWKANLLLDKDREWEAYAVSVAQFSARDLSYEGDIIDAFKGIADHFRAERPTRYIYNIPEVELDEMLLWEPVGSLVRRKSASGSSPIPTWSWAGWKGPVEYRMTRDWPTGWPLISTVIWIARYGKDSKWRLPWKRNIRPSGVYGAASEVTLRSQDYRCKNWQALGWQSSNSERLDRGFWHKDLPGIEFRHPTVLPFANSPSLTLMTTSGELCFMTFSASIKAPPLYESGVNHFVGSENDKALMIGLYNNTDFRERGRTPSLSHSFRYRRAKWRPLYDHARYRIGMVTLNDELLLSAAKPQDLRLISLSRSCSTAFPAPSDADWRALHFKEASELDAKFLDNVKRPEECEREGQIPIRVEGEGENYDGDRYKRKYYGWCNVMLVEVKGEIAFRLGIGRVHHDGFHSANPTWCRINLR